MLLLLEIPSLQALPSRSLVLTGDFTSYTQELCCHNMVRGARERRISFLNAWLTR
jgi:hypothetical protein